jgi:hypothetical protein
LGVVGACENVVGIKQGEKKIEIDLMEALAFCFLSQRGEEN